MSLKVCIAMLLMCVVASLAENLYSPPKHKKKASPYAFSYGVHDAYAGTVFGQDEKSNGNEVLGSYSVQLPDGRKQTVKYKADHHNGFIADVSYYGEAQYPPKSKVPPFIVKPKHHYKPEPPKYKPEPTYH